MTTFYHRRHGGVSVLTLPDEAEKPTANLSVAARAYLATLGITDPDADAETAGLLWMHALAIGYALAYLTTNADGIKQDWPRIPLPDAVETLRASAVLGRQVAALLDSDATVAGVTGIHVRDDIKTIGRLTVMTGGAPDRMVTAGWGHAGQAA